MSFFLKEEEDEEEDDGGVTVGDDVGAAGIVRVLDEKGMVLELFGGPLRDKDMGLEDDKDNDEEE